MSKSLHLTGNKYNIAVMVFTLAYITFAVPANMVFKRFGPRTLGVMMFIWSFFALGQGLTTTWGGLVACRFIMGMNQARATTKTSTGSLTGHPRHLRSGLCSWLCLSCGYSNNSKIRLQRADIAKMSSYYKRNEFLRRYTVFFSASIVAGAFNGLFSYALAHADGMLVLAISPITGC